MVWDGPALLPASVSSETQLVEDVPAVLGRGSRPQVVKGSWVYRPGAAGGFLGVLSSGWKGRMQTAWTGRQLWCHGATTGLWAPKRGLMSRKAKLLGAGARARPTKGQHSCLPGLFWRRSWGPGSPFLSFSSPALLGFQSPWVKECFVTLRPGRGASSPCHCSVERTVCLRCVRPPPGRIAPSCPVLRGSEPERSSLFRSWDDVLLRFGP